MSDLPFEIEPFIDELVMPHITANKMPGVTLSVVHRGETILSKGYGFANFEKQEAVEAERHLFRIGSVSKLFTWVSVMQLAEKGVLDLDCDVNHYLNTFQIPQKYDQLITIRHLMNHSVGFEDVYRKQVVRSADKILTLEENVKNYIPAQVRPPGLVPSYSNYSTSLAGYIVEQISKMSFASYVDENIFKPLKMHSSTFKEALGTSHPENIAKAHLENIALSYKKTRSGYKPARPFFILHHAPAGGMLSTASDMARFMSAILGNGALDGVRILEADTIRELHKFEENDLPEAMSRWSNGFGLKKISGLTTLSHGGTLPFFLTRLMLVPEKQFGVFMSVNSFSQPYAARVANKLVSALADEKPEPAQLKPSQDFAWKGKRFTGTYLSTRRSYRKLEALLPIGNEIKIGVDKEGYLIEEAKSGKTKFLKIGYLKFRSLDGKRFLAFKENAKGQITYLIPMGGQAHEHISVLRSRRFFYPFLGICLASATAALVAWALL